MLIKTRRHRQGRWRSGLYVQVSSTSVIPDLAPFVFANFLGHQASTDESSFDSVSQATLVMETQYDIMVGRQSQPASAWIWSLLSYNIVIIIGLFWTTTHYHRIHPKHLKTTTSGVFFLPPLYSKEHKQLVLMLCYFIRYKRSFKCLHRCSQIISRNAPLSILNVDELIMWL